MPAGDTVALEKAAVPVAVGAQHLVRTTGKSSFLPGAANHTIDVVRVPDGVTLVDRLETFRRFLRGHPGRGVET